MNYYPQPISSSSSIFLIRALRASYLFFPSLSVTIFTIIAAFLLNLAPFGSTSDNMKTKVSSLSPSFGIIGILTTFSISPASKANVPSVCLYSTPGEALCVESSSYSVLYFTDNFPSLPFFLSITTLACSSVARQVTTFDSWKQI